MRKASETTGARPSRVKLTNSFVQTSSRTRSASPIAPAATYAAISDPDEVP